MSAVVSTPRFDLDSVAAVALKAAARSWFVVAVIGQWVFAFAVASFYGLTALRGDYHGWGKFITHGHVPGDTMGNLAVAMHVTSAVVVMLGGALQIMPQVRNRFPVFHRWNGRLYMLAAVGISLAGLYMTWVRGSVGDDSQRLGSTLNAIVIWVCAGMALRHAIARDFRTHRRWALRLFLVAGSAYYYRLVFFLTMAIFKGPVGFDPTTFSGPFPTIMSFAQYLLPLAILEIYLRAQDSTGAIQRMATSALLFAITLAMGAGICVVTLAMWVPDVKAGVDTRVSISETLSATIASRGIDEAAWQYHQLKTSQPSTYNFDESELDALGYQFIQKKRFTDAIRILQLNAEAYPRSSNVHDSLGEAYMDGDNKAQAIAEYKTAIALNPANRNSVLALRKLNSR